MTPTDDKRVAPPMTPLSTCLALHCDRATQAGSHVCAAHWKWIGSADRLKVYELKRQAREWVISKPEMDRLIRELFAESFPVKPWPDYPVVTAIRCAGYERTKYKVKHHNPAFQYLEEKDGGSIEVVAGEPILCYLRLTQGRARFRLHDCGGNDCHEGG